ncbi:hypothetical protein BV25DRAFT_1918979 [Artomyces pyxidatus]|uniref:Uncharacterized protein n=1 Tax=Artomyces pyxidatus TaxID=48021 RepID=A0ACB8SRQ4_9AGAM|nr:hypothetical protein BV25DRAFT_1918979 [Artomyces pyxidatus]
MSGSQVLGLLFNLYLYHDDVVISSCLRFSKAPFIRPLSFLIQHMGQHWDIVNIDKLQRISIYKLGEALPSPLNFDQLLVTPIFLPLHCTKASLYATVVNLNGDPSRGLGRLELPEDVIHCIFDQINDLDDAICFSLSHRRLRIVGRHHVFTLLALEKASSSWIGDRLICIGGETEDLPGDLLTPAEEQALQSWTEEDLQQYNEEQGLELTFEDTNTFDVSGSLVGRSREIDPEEPRITSRGISRLRRGRLRELDAFEILLQPKYHSRHPWILCNFSKRVYVRLDALAKLAGREIETSETPLFNSLCGFAHVLLSRISWSSRSSTAMSYKGKLHRGVWAGDRFEILTMDRLDRHREKDEWADISAEVVKELRAIWKSEFGKNWKQEV